MNDDRWAYPPQPPAPAPSASPPARASRTLAIIAVFVATGIIAAAVGVGAVLLVRHVTANQPSASSPAGSGTSSGAAEARAVYQQAVTATGATAGFHYVAVSNDPSQTIDGDAGQANGLQAITFDSNFGTEQFNLRLVGSTVYFQGNTPAIEDQLGVAAASAAGYQGKWVSVVSGDGPYAVLQPGITTSSQAQEMPLTPESSSRVTLAGGTSATRITGIVPAANDLPAGTGSLLVASTSDLPITYTSSVSASGAVLSFTVKFSAWGTAPSVTAPTTAIRWASLPTSVPSGGFGSGGTPAAAPTGTPSAI